MPSTLTAFFTVNGSVGKNGDNIPLDVMLVQYLLYNSVIPGNKYTNSNFQRNGGWGSNVLPGEAGFMIGPKAVYPYNGTYDPELDQWIEFFQIACNHKGFGPLIEDGRIDPPQRYFGWGKRCIGRVVSWTTMQALNEVAYRRCTNYYANLPSFSDVPPQLGTYLRRVSLSHA